MVLLFPLFRKFHKYFLVQLVLFLILFHFIKSYFFCLAIFPYTLFKVTLCPTPQSNRCRSYHFQQSTLIGFVPSRPAGCFVPNYTPFFLVTPFRRFCSNTLDKNFMVSRLKSSDINEFRLTLSSVYITGIGENFNCSDICNSSYSTHIPLWLFA